MAKDLLLLGVKKIIESTVIPGKPLILGCSGGPDSKALLYLFLKCKRFISYELHVAHVDHGWREESCGQALELQLEVERLGIPFHLKTLNKQDFQPGNWEDQGRTHRLDFFSQLYQDLDAQALILGHHAGDVAEVVLKRLFEGASLPFLGGLTTVSELKKMKVCRPLLSFSKEQILKWLGEREICYFIDPTNESRDFLRGRMRLEMIPFLTASFGKQISSNLCRLGEEAWELKSYFYALNAPLFHRIDADQTLDLTPYLPLPPLQLRYLLKEWIQLEGVFLSYELINGAVEAVLKRVHSARFCSGSGGIEINRDVIKLIKY